MKAKFFNFIFGFLFVLLFMNFASASVEVFSSYNTYIDVNKNYTFDVHKEILLRNIHDVGIVPGQIEFKIQGTAPDEKGEILKYSATNRYGNDIRSKFSETDDGSVILLDIFTPVLPGFEYKIDLKYTVKYDSSGLFFKNIQLPLVEKTKIPIKSGIVEVNLPDSYYVTFVDYQDENTILEDNKVSWNIVGESVPELVNMEYSYIPLKGFGIKGSLIFWLTINIILILILALEIYNEVRKLKKGKK